MTRELLPGRRRSESFRMEVMNASYQVFKYTVTVGYYDGDEMSHIGEVFINSDKITTDLDIAARDAAILLSFALQNGIDPRTIQPSLTRDIDGRPLGLLGTLIDHLYPATKGDPDVISS